MVFTVTIEVRLIIIKSEPRKQPRLIFVTVALAAHSEWLTNSEMSPSKKHVMPFFP